MDYTEKELKEFVGWFFSNLNMSEARWDDVLICMCGYFRISKTMARRQMKRCFVLGLLWRIKTRSTITPRMAGRLKKRNETKMQRPTGATQL